MTFSNTFRIRDDPAMALYDAVLAGSFREDFSKGRKLHASMLGVICHE